MAKERAPAFQVYAADYLSDENAMAMELDEFGAYWKLELICWREGSIPADLSRLARLLKCPLEQMQRMWPAIEPCFRPGEPGRLVHPRLEKERTKQALNREKRAKAGRASGEARKPNTTEQVSNTCSTGVEQTGNGGGTKTNLSVCSLPATQQTTDAIASGAAPRDIVPLPVDDLSRPAVFRAAACPLIRKHWWLGLKPPPAAVAKEGEWDEGRDAKILLDFVSRKFCTPEEALAMIEQARTFFDFGDIPICGLIFTAKGKGNRANELLGFIRKRGSARSAAALLAEVDYATA